MPDYASLSGQIDAVKSEITSSLAASTYSAQDLVFVAKALETLGTLLGVSDIVAATTAQVTSINTAGSTQLTAIGNAGSTQVAAINSAGTTKLTAIQNEANALSILSYMGVLA
jgi:hypothetical protein